ncbi:MAG: antibiotic biosynthesis monooxygenase [Mogibacterium sp.]|nr:antibiotic biosynthesis monooxygenase [Mogibacterium sp.]
MLVLNVIFKCAPGTREELRELVRSEGIDVASRNEEGNFKYEFFMSTEDPDDILLIEWWKNVDAWMAHRTLPHYKKLDEIKKGRVISAEIRKYFTEDDV